MWTMTVPYQNAKGAGRVFNTEPVDSFPLNITTDKKENTTVGWLVRRVWVPTFDQFAPTIHGAHLVFFRLSVTVLATPSRLRRPLLARSGASSSLAEQTLAAIPDVPPQPFD